MPEKNYVVLAVPFFFVLMAVEIAIVRWRSKGYYRLGDAINSISCGILSQVFEAAVGPLPFIFVYNWVGRAAWTKLDPSSVWTWGVSFLSVDFLYYWWHRSSHEYNVLWAAHIVHHQSEDYNLSTALRQSWFTSFTGAVFYLPLALIGVPFQVYFGGIGLMLIYQYWIHTQLIDRLGPLEWVLNTPSHHRVHHGVNPEYVDKNYGGILIIWDRLFGTFAEERAPVIYGTVKPVETWNPVRNAIDFWVELASGRRRWFVSPEWTPGDPHPPLVLKEYRPDGYRKYDVVSTPSSRKLALGAFLLVLVVTAVLLNFQDRFPFWARFGYALATAAALAGVSRLIRTVPESQRSYR